MATVFESINLIRKWHYLSLNAYDKKFIKAVADGVDGLGNPSDEEIKEYLSAGQINHVRKIGLKFLITKNTKV